MAGLNLKIPARYRRSLRVGTCSWKYEGWKGLIYRSGVKYAAGDYLVDYAKHFNTVEVDQWFWSLFPSGVKLPDPQAAREYAQSVPDDFVFTVKAPNAITLTHHYAKQTAGHRAFANKPNPDFLSRDLLKRFLAALAPMGGKLGPIMFQFEYLNKSKMPSLQAFLEALHEFFQRAPKDFSYAIETRNPNYLSEAFFNFLREHTLGFVFLEGYYMPHISEVFGRHDTATEAPTIVRLHGPEREAMEEASAGRWDRLLEPRPESINAAVEIVRANLRLGRKTFVNINNHFEGCAPLTAERFLKEYSARPRQANDSNLSRALHSADGFCGRLLSARSVRQRADQGEVQLAFRAPAGCAGGDLRPELLIELERFLLQFLRAQGLSQLRQSLANRLEMLAEFHLEVAFDRLRRDGLVLDQGADALRSLHRRNRPAANLHSEFFDLSAAADRLALQGLRRSVDAEAAPLRLRVQPCEALAQAECLVVFVPHPLRDNHGPERQHGSAIHPDLVRHPSPLSARRQPSAIGQFFLMEFILPAAQALFLVGGRPLAGQSVSANCQHRLA